MKNARAARRYAMALLGDAEQKNVVDAVAGDLERLGRLIHGSRELRSLIASPLVSIEKKSRVLSVLLGTGVSKETVAFLHMLVEKHREPLLPEIGEQFAALRDEKLGIVTVDVAAAVEFASSQERTLHDRLERYTQKKVRLRFTLDKSIKGGLVIRIGDTVLDASITHQLDLLRERLVGARSS